MEKNNDLISVIEELLEADMTAPKKVKNPQNKMAEEEQVDEAQDKTDKSIAANKLTDTAKPKSDKQGDNSSEVIGSEKGAALDAGGDKDVGDMNKGKIASTASDNSKEVGIGAADKGVLDAGGDKDVGPDKKSKTAGSNKTTSGFPSDASSEVEANKGPHNQAMDEAEEIEDEAIEEAGQDTKIEKNANDEQLPDEEKESMKNMKEAEDEIEAELTKEELEWDWEKIDSLSEEDFQELVDSLSEEDLAEFNAHYEALEEENEIEEASDDNKDDSDDEDDDSEDEDEDDSDDSKDAKEEVEVEEAAKDKGDMDKDGIDEPDDKEYMDNKDKAIKKAMAKEESDENEEVEEATGEKLEKVSTKSHNEPMRPGEEKGDNAPVDKGGDPSKGPHDQSKDPNETPTKANPKKTVKEETDDLMEELEEDFKEKAAVIFETAVNEKANLIREEIEAEYAQMLEEKVDEVNNRVDEYVDYVVNEWLEENQLEIKYSLRTEIAENFIREMKKVFETNFIDIPEEEVSVVDELTEAVESYKEQIEEQASELEAAKKELLEIKRKEIVEAIGEDLPQTQKIRLEKLSENVEADDIEEFRYKVEQLKEGYFDESSEQPLLSSLSEEVFGGAIIEEEDDSSISQYAKFLSKTVTK